MPSLQGAPTASRQGSLPLVRQTSSGPARPEYGRATSAGRSVIHFSPQAAPACTLLADPRWDKISGFDPSSEGSLFRDRLAPMNKSVWWAIAAGVAGIFI